MRFNFFSENRPQSSESEAEKIATLRQEETKGLRRFYREIATPEILRRNFEHWQNHLRERLAEKYLEPADMQAAIKAAGEYASRLPICHETNYKNLRASKFPYIASDFMIRGLGYYDAGGMGAGNTQSGDRRDELDHFVYGSLGVEGRHRRSNWDTQLYLQNAVLQEEGTVVALEDLGDTIPRLIPQAYKGNHGSAGPEEAFEVHLQQLWNGRDFTVLLPLMLAYAYENPEDFDLQKPFPLDLVPEDLPRLIKRDDHFYSSLQADFPKFEVRIPSTVNPADIIAVCVDELAITDPPSERNVVVVPNGLSPQERHGFILAKLANLVESKKAG